MKQHISFYSCCRFKLHGKKQQVGVDCDEINFRPVKLAGRQPTLKPLPSLSPPVCSSPGRNIVTCPWELCISKGLDLEFLKSQKIMKVKYTFENENLWALDMSYWRKIVNDYREGFHGVISQPKSPKIANFGQPSGNCLKSILKQKIFLGIMNPWDLVSAS